MSLHNQGNGTPNGLNGVGYQNHLTTQTPSVTPGSSLPHSSSPAYVDSSDYHSVNYNCDSNSSNQRQQGNDQHNHQHNHQHNIHTNQSNPDQYEYGFDSDEWNTAYQSIEQKIVSILHTSTSDNNQAINALTDPHITLFSAAAPGLNRALESLFSRPALTLPVFTPAENTPLQPIDGDGLSGKNGPGSISPPDLPPDLYVLPTKSNDTTNTDTDENKQDKSEGKENGNTLSSLINKLVAPAFPTDPYISVDEQQPKRPKHQNIDSLSTSRMDKQPGLQQPVLPQLYCHIFFTKRGLAQYQLLSLIQTNQQLTQRTHPQASAVHTGLIKTFLEELREMITQIKQHLPTENINTSLNNTQPSESSPQAEQSTRSSAYKNIQNEMNPEIANITTLTNHAILNLQAILVMVSYTTLTPQIHSINPVQTSMSSQRNRTLLKNRDNGNVGEDYNQFDLLNEVMVKFQSTLSNFESSPSSPSSSSSSPTVTDQSTDEMVENTSNTTKPTLEQHQTFLTTLQTQLSSLLAITSSILRRQQPYDITVPAHDASILLPPPPLMVFQAQLFEDGLKWKGVWVELSISPHSFIELSERTNDTTYHLADNLRHELDTKSIHLCGTFPLHYLAPDPGMGSFVCEASTTHNHGLSHLTDPHRPTMYPGTVENEAILQSLKPQYMKYVSEDNLLHHELRRLNDKSNNPSTNNVTTSISSSSNRQSSSRKPGTNVNTNGTNTNPPSPIGMGMPQPDLMMRGFELQSQFHQDISHLTNSIDDYFQEIKMPKRAHNYKKFPGEQEKINIFLDKLFAKINISTRTNQLLQNNHKNTKTSIQEQQDPPLTKPCQKHHSSKSVVSQPTQCTCVNESNGSFYDFLNKTHLVQHQDPTLQKFPVKYHMETPFLPLFPSHPKHERFLFNFTPEFDYCSPTSFKPHGVSVGHLFDEKDGLDLVDDSIHSYGQNGINDAVNRIKMDKHYFTTTIWGNEDMFPKITHSPYDFSNSDDGISYEDTDDDDDDDDEEEEEEDNTQQDVSVVISTGDGSPKMTNTKRLKPMLCRHPRPQQYFPSLILKPRQFIPTPAHLDHTVINSFRDDHRRQVGWSMILPATQNLSTRYNYDHSPLLQHLLSTIPLPHHTLSTTEIKSRLYKDIISNYKEDGVHAHRTTADPTNPNNVLNLPFHFHPKDTTSILHTDKIIANNRPDDYLLEDQDNDALVDILNQTEFTPIPLYQIPLTQDEIEETSYWLSDVHNHTNTGLCHAFTRFVQTTYRDSSRLIHVDRSLTSKFGPGQMVTSVADSGQGQQYPQSNLIVKEKETNPADWTPTSQCSCLKPKTPLCSHLHTVMGYNQDELNCITNAPNETTPEVLLKTFYFQQKIHSLRKQAWLATQQSNQPDQPTQVLTPGQINPLYPQFQTNSKPPIQHSLNSPLSSQSLIQTYPQQSSYPLKSQSGLEEPIEDGYQYNEIEFKSLTEQELQLLDPSLYSPLELYHSKFHCIDTCLAPRCNFGPAPHTCVAMEDVIASGERDPLRVDKISCDALICQNNPNGFVNMLTELLETSNFPAALSRIDDINVKIHRIDKEITKLRIEFRTAHFHFLSNQSKLTKRAAKLLLLLGDPNNVTIDGAPENDQVDGDLEGEGEEEDGDEDLVALSPTQQFLDDRSVYKVKRGILMKQRAKFESKVLAIHKNYPLFLFLKQYIIDSPVLLEEQIPFMMDLIEQQILLTLAQTSSEEVVKSRLFGGFNTRKFTRARGEAHKTFEYSIDSPDNGYYKDQKKDNKPHPLDSDSDDEFFVWDENEILHFAEDYFAFKLQDKPDLEDNKTPSSQYNFPIVGTQCDSHSASVGEEKYTPSKTKQKGRRRESKYRTQAGKLLHISTIQSNIRYPYTPDLKSASSTTVPGPISRIDKLKIERWYKFMPDLSLSQPPNPTYDYQSSRPIVQVQQPSSIKTNHRWYQYDYRYIYLKPNMDGLNHAQLTSNYRDHHNYMEPFSRIAPPEHSISRFPNPHLDPNWSFQEPIVESISRLGFGHTSYTMTRSHECQFALQHLSHFKQLLADYRLGFSRQTSVHTCGFCHECNQCADCCLKNSLAGIHSQLFALYEDKVKSFASRSAKLQYPIGATPGQHAPNLFLSLSTGDNIPLFDCSLPTLHSSSSCVTLHNSDDQHNPFIHDDCDHVVTNNNSNDNNVIPDTNTTTCDCDCSVAFGVLWLISDSHSIVLRVGSLQAARVISLVSRHIIEQLCDPLQWQHKKQSFRYCLPFLQEQSMAHNNLVFCQNLRSENTPPTTSIALSDMRSEEFTHTGLLACQSLGDPSAGSVAWSGASQNSRAATSLKEEADAFSFMPNRLPITQNPSTTMTPRQSLPHAADFYLQDPAASGVRVFAECPPQPQLPFQASPWYNIPDSLCQATVAPIHTVFPSLANRNNMIDNFDDRSLGSMDYLHHQQNYGLETASHQIMVPNWGVMGPEVQRAHHSENEIINLYYGPTTAQQLQQQQQPMTFKYQLCYNKPTLSSFVPFSGHYDQRPVTLLRKEKCGVLTIQIPTSLILQPSHYPSTNGYVASGEIAPIGNGESSLGPKDVIPLTPSRPLVNPPTPHLEDPDLDDLDQVLPVLEAFRMQSYMGQGTLSRSARSGLRLDQRFVDSFFLITGSFLPVADTPETHHPHDVVDYNEDFTDDQLVLLNLDQLRMLHDQGVQHRREIFQIQLHRYEQQRFRQNQAIRRQLQQNNPNQAPPNWDTTNTYANRMWRKLPPQFIYGGHPTYYNPWGNQPYAYTSVFASTFSGLNIISPLTYITALSQPDCSLNLHLPITTELLNVVTSAQPHVSHLVDGSFPIRLDCSSIIMTRGTRPASLGIDFQSTLIGLITGKTSFTPLDMLNWRIKNSKPPPQPDSYHSDGTPYCTVQPEDVVEDMKHFELFAEQLQREHDKISTFPYAPNTHYDGIPGTLSDLEVIISNSSALGAVLQHASANASYQPVPQIALLFRTIDRILHYNGPYDNHGVNNASTSFTNYQREFIAKLIWDELVQDYKHMVDFYRAQYNTSPSSSNNNNNNNTSLGSILSTPSSARSTRSLLLTNKPKHKQRSPSSSFSQDDKTKRPPSPTKVIPDPETLLCQQATMNTLIQPHSHSVPSTPASSPYVYREFYFTIFGGTLFYYKDSRVSSPTDFVTLSNATIILDRRALAQGEFIFLIRTPLRTVTCKAKHIAQLIEWITHISLTASQVSRLSTLAPLSLRCDHGNALSSIPRNNVRAQRACIGNEHLMDSDSFSGGGMHFDIPPNNPHLNHNVKKIHNKHTVVHSNVRHHLHFKTNYHNLLMITVDNALEAVYKTYQRHQRLLNIHQRQVNYSKVILAYTIMIILYTQATQAYISYFQQMSLDRDFHKAEMNAIAANLKKDQPSLREQSLNKMAKGNSSTNITSTSSPSSSPSKNSSINSIHKLIKELKTAMNQFKLLGVGDALLDILQKFESSFDQIQSTLSQNHSRSTKLPSIKPQDYISIQTRLQTTLQLFYQFLPHLTSSYLHHTKRYDQLLQQLKNASPLNHFVLNGGLGSDSHLMYSIIIRYIESNPHDNDPLLSLKLMLKNQCDGMELLRFLKMHSLNPSRTGGNRQSNTIPVDISNGDSKSNQFTSNVNILPTEYHLEGALKVDQMISDFLHHLITPPAQITENNDNLLSQQIDAFGLREYLTDYQLQPPQQQQGKQSSKEQQSIITWARSGLAYRPANHANVFNPPQHLYQIFDTDGIQSYYSLLGMMYDGTAPVTHICANETVLGVDSAAVIIDPWTGQCQPSLYGTILSPISPVKHIDEQFGPSQMPDHVRNRYHIHNQFYPNKSSLHLMSIHSLPTSIPNRHDTLLKMFPMYELEAKTTLKITPQGCDSDAVCNVGQPEEQPKTLILPSLLNPYYYNYDLFVKPLPNWIASKLPPQHPRSSFAKLAAIHQYENIIQCGDLNHGDESHSAKLQQNDQYLDSLNHFAIPAHPSLPSTMTRPHPKSRQVYCLAPLPHQTYFLNWRHAETILQKFFIIQQGGIGSSRTTNVRDLYNHLYNIIRLPQAPFRFNFIGKEQTYHAVESKLLVPPPMHSLSFELLFKHTELIPTFKQFLAQIIIPTYFTDVLKIHETERIKAIVTPPKIQSIRHEIKKWSAWSKITTALNNQRDWRWGYFLNCVGKLKPYQFIDSKSLHTLTPNTLYQKQFLPLLNSALNRLHKQHLNQHQKHPNHSQSHQIKQSSSQRQKSRRLSLVMEEKDHSLSHDNSPPRLPQQHDLSPVERTAITEKLQKSTTNQVMNTFNCFVYLREFSLLPNITTTSIPIYLTKLYRHFFIPSPSASSTASSSFPSGAVIPHHVTPSTTYQQLLDEFLVFARNQTKIGSNGFRITDNSSNTCSPLSSNTITSASNNANNTTGPTNGASSSSSSKAAKSTKLIFPSSRALTSQLEAACFIFTQYLSPLSSNCLEAIPTTFINQIVLSIVYELLHHQKVNPFNHSNDYLSFINHHSDQGLSVYEGKVFKTDTLSLLNNNMNQSVPELFKSINDLDSTINTSNVDDDINIQIIKRQHGDTSIKETNGNTFTTFVLHGPTVAHLGNITLPDNVKSNHNNHIHPSYQSPVGNNLDQSFKVEYIDVTSEIERMYQTFNVFAWDAARNAKIRQQQNNVRNKKKSQGNQHIDDIDDLFDDKSSEPNELFITEESAVKTLTSPLLYAKQQTHRLYDLINKLHHFFDGEKVFLLSNDTVHTTLSLPEKHKVVANSIGPLTRNSTNNHNHNNSNNNSTDSAHHHSQHHTDHLDVTRGLANVYRQRRKESRINSSTNPYLPSGIESVYPQQCDCQLIAPKHLPHIHSGSFTHIADILYFRIQQWFRQFLIAPMYRKATTTFITPTTIGGMLNDYGTVLNEYDRYVYVDLFQNYIPHNKSTPVTPLPTASATPTASHHFPVPLSSQHQPQQQQQQQQPQQQHLSHGSTLNYPDNNLTLTPQQSYNSFPQSPTNPPLFYNPRRPHQYTQALLKLQSLVPLPSHVVNRTPPPPVGMDMGSKNDHNSIDYSLYYNGFTLCLNSLMPGCSHTRLFLKHVYPAVAKLEMDYLSMVRSNVEEFSSEQQQLEQIAFNEKLKRKSSQQQIDCTSPLNQRNSKVKTNNHYTSGSNLNDVYLSNSPSADNLEGSDCNNEISEDEDSNLDHETIGNTNPFNYEVQTSVNAPSRLYTMSKEQIINAPESLLPFKPRFIPAQPQIQPWQSTMSTRRYQEKTKAELAKAEALLFPNELELQHSLIINPSHSSIDSSSISSSSTGIAAGNSVVIGSTPGLPIQGSNVPQAVSNIRSTFTHLEKVNPLLPSYSPNPIQLLKKLHEPKHKQQQQQQQQQKDLPNNLQLPTHLEDQQDFVRPDGSRLDSIDDNTNDNRDGETNPIGMSHNSVDANSKYVYVASRVPTPINEKRPTKWNNIPIKRRNDTDAPGINLSGFIKSPPSIKPAFGIATNNALRLISQPVIGTVPIDTTIRSKQPSMSQTDQYPISCNNDVNNVSEPALTGATDESQRYNVIEALYSAFEAQASSLESSPSQDPPILTTTAATGTITATTTTTGQKGTFDNNHPEYHILLHNDLNASLNSLHHSECTRRGSSTSFVSANDSSAMLTPQTPSYLESSFLPGHITAQGDPVISQPSATTVAEGSLLTLQEVYNVPPFHFDQSPHSLELQLKNGIQPTNDEVMYQQHLANTNPSGRSFVFLLAIRSQKYSSNSSSQSVVSRPIYKTLRPGAKHTIGREQINTIVIDDSRVSRAHANISLGADGITCVYNDLGSSSGSKVNGTQISTTVLRNGDVIEIGMISIHCMLIPIDALDKLSQR